MATPKIGNQFISAMKTAATNVVAPAAKEASKQGAEAIRDKSLGYMTDRLANGPKTNDKKIVKAESAPAKVKQTALNLTKWAVPIIATAALATVAQAAFTAVLA